MTGQPAASVSRRVAAECRRVARAAVFSNGDSTSSVASTAAGAGAAALARPLPPDRSDAPFRRLNSVRLEMLQSLQTGLVSRPKFISVSISVLVSKVWSRFQPQTFRLGLEARV